MNTLNLKLTNQAYARICALMAAESPAHFLRISVESGGCNGFQYQYQIDSEKKADDLTCSVNGAHVIIDAVSANFLDGCTLDFIDDMMGKSFQIKNPAAESSCGCGNSFSV